MIILNKLGQEVYVNSLRLNEGTNTINLDMSDFKPGVYTAYIKGTTSVSLTGKLIKK